MSETKRGKLLLADNDADYRRSLGSFLRLEDYEVIEATTVEEAKERLETVPVDLVLVDLRLTDDDDEFDFSGLEVAKKAGEKGIPCIMITAFPSVEATRGALRSRGSKPLAVDFVPKAGGPQTILDTVGPVLRSRRGGPEAIQGLEIDVERGLIWLAGDPLDLSKQQYALLAHLYAKEGALCSHEELYQAVYDEHLEPGAASADRRLERLVERVRLKIEEDPSEPRYLKTVHGRGFRLALDG